MSSLNIMLTRLGLAYRRESLSKVAKYAIVKCSVFLFQARAAESGRGGQLVKTQCINFNYVFSLDFYLVKTHVNVFSRFMLVLIYSCVL